MCTGAFRTVLAIVSLATFLSVAPAARADVVRDEIDAQLRAARQTGCASPSDTLAEILCAGRIRVGVRDNYRGFGVRDATGYSGFEIDVVNQIAQRLGITPALVTVTPATRIAKLVSGEVDMVVATMGHTITRDKQISFVRPHYFASHTSIMGPRQLAIDGLPGLAGRTICVPVGAASNIAIARAQARLMLYDAPQQLVDALRFGTCTIAAHDNTLWADALTDRHFAARFEEKVALDEIPWGIGVRAERSDMLAHLLGLIVLDFYRSGLLTELAVKHKLPTSFVAAQSVLWAKPDCVTPRGDPVPACLMAPYDDVEVPTSFAGPVKALENVFNDRLGIRISLPMLTGYENFQLFGAGIVNTLILVMGAIGATLGFAMLVQAGIRHGAWFTAIPVRLLAAFFRSSPTVLLLLLGYYIVTAITTYGPGIALLTAMVAIGIVNGCFAGVAIADAATSLEHEADGQRVPLVLVLKRASTQITGLMVNAARASAVAAFIGIPELLNTLNDIASVSSERQTTFIILLMFYLLIIYAVLRLTRLLSRSLDSYGSAS